MTTFEGKDQKLKIIYFLKKCMLGTKFTKYVYHEIH